MNSGQIPKYPPLNWFAWILFVIGCGLIGLGALGLVWFALKWCIVADSAYDRNRQFTAGIVLSFNSAAAGFTMLISAYLLWAFRDLAINSWRLANRIAPLPPEPTPEWTPPAEPSHWWIHGKNGEGEEVEVIISALSEAEARSIAFSRGIQVLSVAKLSSDT